MIKKLSLVLAALTICSYSCVSNIAFASDINADKVKESIIKHSLEMNIDPALALSLAKKESNYNHSLKSRHGAVGVYQLMPATAKKLGVNPYYLNENIKGGLTYYKMMYDMFGSTELALAAYNAGPGNVKKYNAIPPFTETKHFVSKIMADYHALKKQPDPILLKILDEQRKNLDLDTIPQTELTAKENIPELPVVNEIPEVREPSVEMQSL